MHLLQMSNVSYKKNGRVILGNVDLTLDKGHFVGLAGINGAGKTTLMRLIVGVSKASAGQIEVAGVKAADLIKEHVSFSDGLVGFPKGTQVKNVAAFYQHLYPDFKPERYQQLAEFLNLQSEDKVKDLSKGTRERLTIAVTLARDTDLYLLDEPFSGVDVIGRKKIIASILDWIGDDSTIMISSHHLEEISEALDELVIIKDQTVFDHKTRAEMVELGNDSANPVEQYFEHIYEGEE
ncbi:ATP-binding cassette domain-containing protein [Bombilactobacillus thymidiniphilus]|uniref:ABC transporter ATP-binding protein n=1 Tax=Bombilactobacillus thymidiniphilus TaxID=2923363 RepID=A0ABY4PEI2_9LACO|nr:ABC transporter ATP-binding protein [Bombilactobacillus thymidiniphilus]UQS84089.1 ABC transporter ATP-binding protein [Bombilactobacillus thymidiniphilus]